MDESFFNDLGVGFLERSIISAFFISYSFNIRIVYRIHRKDSRTPVGHYPGADCHQSSTIPPWPCHYPGADCHQSSTIPPCPMCVTIQVQTATSHQPFHPGLCVSLSRGRLPPVINHSTLAYVCHYPGADCHQSSTIPPWPMCVTIQVQTATSHQPFHPGLCVSLSRGRLPPVLNHSTLTYVCHYPGADCHQSSTIPPWPCHYPGADCHQSSTIPPWPMCVTIQVQTATSINHSTLAYVCHYPGADCHQSSTIPPWPMCVTIQGQTATSHQPFHPGLVTIQGQTATSHQPFHPGLCVSLSRGRLPPVLNHSTLTYVCDYPGADCHQSSTIPPWPMCVTIQGQTATSHQPFHPGLCVSLSRGRLPPVLNHSTLAYVCHYPGADCHQSSTIPPWPMCVTIRGRLPPVINHSTLAYVCHYPGADCHQSSTIPPWPMCVTIQVQTATSHQPFHPDLCVWLSRCRLPPVINHSTLTYVCDYPGADCHQSSTIPPWPMWVTIQVQTATSHQPFHPDLCVSLSRGRLPPVINHSTLAYVCHYPGADCHQSSTIPPWPMCVTIQVQTATSHQPFHPDLCVSLSRGRLPPVINHSTLAYVCHYPGADCHQSSTIPPWPMCVTIQVQTATSHQPFHPDLCVSLSRCRLPPVINHSTLAYVGHYPGADCHQSSTIPPWPMCVTIQGQTATSPQPFHPGLCVSLSRGRLPPVINHSTLAYVCHYPGADCHQSSTIPPWPMCVTIQVQTATSHQPFHPDLCVWLSRCRLPPVINHSTLTYVCDYPGADCHQSSTIPPWPMWVTIQVQTATSHQPFHPDLCVSLSRGRLPPVINHSTLAYVCHYPGADCHHQPFHPGLCVSLSRCRLPPVINHSTLTYVCHYPGADCHQSSTIPPWPMCVTIQGQTATSHQPFHPDLCVSLSRCRLPPVINHSTLAYVCHYPGADCHQSSIIPPWPVCVTIQGQTATSHQPFHPDLCVSLSRCRLPPVINHSTLAYVCHYPGADCHQSSIIPPWPVCVTIQGQTATSHQPFHPDLCVSLSRCRLPPVINHSTLACVCHYPGADCHQSSTIPPWPMCVTTRCRLPPVINHSTLTYVCHYPGADCHQSSTIPPWPMCVTIQVQTATSHQPFHPGLCVSLSRGRLPPVINHSTLTYVCHYPGADCHQSSTIPPWPMCVTIQGQTATSHQPFHPGLYVCHYPGADCHQSSTIPPWPICVSLSRGRLPPVINHSTLAYVCHYPGAV